MKYPNQIPFQLIKSTITMAFLVIFCYLNQAQPFVDSNARWKYLYGYFYVSGELDLYVERDSVFNGEQCQYLRRIYNVYDRYIQMQRVDIAHGGHFVYYKDQQLFVWHDDRFDMLFDMNDAPGVVRNFYDEKLLRHSDSPFVMEVLDTLQYQIGSEWRRALAVQYSWEKSPNHILVKYDTIVDGIGNIKNFLLPWNLGWRPIDAHIADDFICFNDQELIYPNDSCDAISSMLNTKKIRTKVYPNPVVDELNFDLTNEIEQLIRIRNALGELMISQKYYSSESLDVSKLPPGYYIGSLHSKNSYYSFVFIKE